MKNHSLRAKTQVNFDQTASINHDVEMTGEALGVDLKATVDKANKLVKHLTDTYGDPNSGDFNNVSHLVEEIQKDFTHRELAFLLGNEILQKAQREAWESRGMGDLLEMLEKNIR